MRREDQLMQDFAEALNAIPVDNVKGVSAPPGGQSQASMALPPGLVEEVARVLFEFWEQHIEAHGGRKALRWEQLPPKYQMAWIKISHIVLEMATRVIMTDAYRFLDASNGDMGAAFARALKRYVEVVLQSDLRIE